MPDSYRTVSEELASIGNIDASFETVRIDNPYSFRGYDEYLRAKPKALPALKGFKKNHFGHLVRDKSVQPKALEQPKGLNCERCAGPLPSCYGVSVKCEYCGVVNLLTDQPMPLEEPKPVKVPEPEPKIKFWHMVILTLGVLAGVFFIFTRIGKKSVQKIYHKPLVK